MTRISVTKEIMEKIAFRLADGQSLNAICKDKDMPHRDTVSKAVLQGDDEEIKDLYSNARIMQMEKLLDDCLDIVDEDLPNDMDSRFLNAEVHRRRLKIDTLKWVIARMSPRGLTNRGEDVEKDKSITISWADGEVVAAE